MVPAACGELENQIPNLAPLITKRVLPTKSLLLRGPQGTSAASRPVPRRLPACSSRRDAGNNLKVTHQRPCVWGLSWFGSESPGPGSRAEPGVGRTSAESSEFLISQPPSGKRSYRRGRAALKNGPVLSQRLMCGSVDAPYTAGVCARPCSHPSQETEGCPDSPVTVDQCPGGRFTDRCMSQTTGRKFHFQTSLEFFTDSLYSKYVSLCKGSREAPPARGPGPRPPQGQS